jgi:hypothetical protein
VTGVGSTYPSLPYIKTTTLADRRYPLDDNWNVINDHTECLLEYPRLRDKVKLSWSDTAAPHVSRHSGLGAD